MDTTEVKPNKKTTPWKRYFKKLGIIGFLFFLIKGLVWLVVFALGAKGCSTLIAS